MNRIRHSPCSPPFKIPEFFGLLTGGWLVLFPNLEYVKMIRVSIYEQEMFGTVHWRVMRDDGRLIFDRFQTDFPSREEALSAVQGEFRRKHLQGTVRIQSFSGTESLSIGEPAHA